MKRSLPVVAATLVGVVSAGLWIGGAIMIGSRLGEVWAGSRRQRIGDFRAEAA
jgi:hypothetical protein